MWKSWMAVACLSAFGLVSFTQWSDPSWAKPKKTTYLSCKCTCRAEDELGKFHYGPTNGIWYTTSGDSCTLFHKCTVGSQKLEGIATDCSETEKSLSVRPGIINRVEPGLLVQP